MGGGEQLRQGGFDFVTQIDVDAGGGVGFLFHAAEIKPGNGGAGEKISQAREDAGAVLDCINLFESVLGCDPCRGRVCYVRVPVVSLVPRSTTG
jgi:hypothetical protein